MAKEQQYPTLTKQKKPQKHYQKLGLTQGLFTFFDNFLEDMGLWAFLRNCAK